MNVKQPAIRSRPVKIRFDKGYGWRAKIGFVLIATDRIINDYASYSKLLSLMQEEHYLKGEQLCEVIMMKGILEEYNSQY